MVIKIEFDVNFNAQKLFAFTTFYVVVFDTYAHLEPYGTPKRVSSHVIYHTLFIFVLYFLLDK